MVAARRLVRQRRRGPTSLTRSRADGTWTERLHLLPFAHEDEDALVRLFNDRDVRRYLWDDEPVARERVRELIGWSLDSFARRGPGYFTLRLRERLDRVVGIAGLRPVFEPERIELLYALEPRVWKRGLATEAARAVLSFGFDDLGLEEILAGADPPNRDSFRVMERLGMRFAFDSELGGRPARYYALSRPDG